MKIKNKKGDILLPEVLRLVIAVFCIILLIVLGFLIYGLFTKRTKLLQAKETLEQINLEIEALQNQWDKKDYLAVAPSDWFVYGFQKIDWQGQEQTMPDRCKGSNCLCICDLTDEIRVDDDAVKMCDKRGVCKDYSQIIRTKPSPTRGIYEELGFRQIGGLSSEIKLSNEKVFHRQEYGMPLPIAIIRKGEYDSSGNFYDFVFLFPSPPPHLKVYDWYDDLLSYKKDLGSESVNALAIKILDIMIQDPNLIGFADVEDTGNIDAKNFRESVSDYFKKVGSEGGYEKFYYIFTVSTKVESQSQNSNTRVVSASVWDWVTGQDPGGSNFKGYGFLEKIYRDENGKIYSFTLKIDELR